MIDFTRDGTAMVSFIVVGNAGRKIELTLSTFLALAKASKSIEELRREIFAVATPAPTRLAAKAIA